MSRANRRQNRMTARQRIESRRRRSSPGWLEPDDLSHSTSGEGRSAAVGFEHFYARTRPTPVVSVFRKQTPNVPVGLVDREGLARAVATRSQRRLAEELTGRPSTTPPIGRAQRCPTVPANEAADDFVALLADD
jgi:hypothetical protein